MMERVPCADCGAEILWVTNENGDSEAFDTKPTRILKVAGDREPDGTTHSYFATVDLKDVTEQIQVGRLPHRSTCPNAKAG